jgi:Tol biopolymer transport system component
MTLAAGSRLGRYEILAPLGAGGMGEVYRARDTRLERTVAVKVLPARLSPSADARQRFEREARTISQLAHPHICALYDVGREGETEYLVMELLEGETLLDRLAKGALPLEQTLRYGQEMADALDKAHRQGIVHRDLKPANVMLTKTGVKLLDFGLAKAMAPPPAQGSLTALPTQQGLTQEGTILGTFQYMAPEQLEGKEADGRTDIFALGAVLYEMATGRKAFTGTSQASLISSIMKEDPAPISSLQPMTPPALDRVVKTCLGKDPEDRWQSAHDVAGELKWIAGGSQAGVPAAVATRRRSRERLAWTLAGLAAAATVAFAVAYARRTPRSAPVVRASLVLPEKTYIGDVAISPDGRRIAFTAAKLGGQPALWVRDLDEAAPVRLTGDEEDLRFPFWSPDGRFVAFFVPGKLQRIGPHGGAVQTICNVESGTGGTWNRDGTIVFAPNATSPLFRVAAAGGKPEPLTKLDSGRNEASHRYPQFLPDGRHFLYLATDLGSGKGGQSAIRVTSLDGGSDKVVVSVASNFQYADGWLLYVRDLAVVAQRFDPGRLDIAGVPSVIAPLVFRWSGYLGCYTFAASDGAVVVAPPFTPPSTLLWLDRGGRQLGSLGEPGPLGGHRLSPDGRRVALARRNPGKGTSEIWLYDVATGSGSKFVFSPPADYDDPVWSPDGSRLLYQTDRRTGANGSSDLWIKALDGSSETPFVVSNDFNFTADWSRDGRTIAVHKIPEKGSRNTEVWVLNTADPKHQTAFEAGGTIQADARFSPDGRWIAFDSNESGTTEVYVRAFPGPGGKWKVSDAGGAFPHWRGDGPRALLREQRQQAHGGAGANRAVLSGRGAGASVHDSGKRDWHRLRGGRRRAAVSRRCGDERRGDRPAPDRPDRQLDVAAFEERTGALKAS